MTSDPKVWAWLKFIAPVIALVIVAWWITSQSPETPDRCEAATDTPCLSSEGIVRWIDLDGRYRFESLSEWRDAKAEAQYEQVPPFSGPGPNAP